MPSVAQFCHVSVSSALPPFGNSGIFLSVPLWHNATITAAAGDAAHSSGRDGQASHLNDVTL
jgi:hypothetical protein